jgi:hypothetical protein
MPNRPCSRRERRHEQGRTGFLAHGRAEHTDDQALAASLKGTRWGLREIQKLFFTPLGSFAHVEAEALLIEKPSPTQAFMSFRMVSLRPIAMGTFVKYAMFVGHGPGNSIA